ncbi:MAG: hypothetical protein N4A53_07170 [Pelagimonas sp.]|nr:hypothetical protein [Pelagimonas sp.]
MDEGLAELTSEGAREFFDIGAPMSNPVSPSGTILLSLKRSFLKRNHASFLWASIPDNGGIRSGFLPNFSKNSYKSVRLSFDLFSEVLDQIELLPSECREAVLEKRPSERFCNSIRGLVEESVVEGMLVQPMQAARRIEFCLGADLEISDSDVEAVHVPNTYKGLLGPKTTKFNPNKLAYYNPKNSIMNLKKI